MTTLAAPSIPAGAMFAFGGDNTNIPTGFLLCNGALLNRNDYSDLFDAIGTHWGTASGVDFRIPTTQGLFVRGVAYGSGNDPDRASRTTIQTGGSTGDQVGTYQSDRYQSHNHSGGTHTHSGASHRHEGGHRGTGANTGALIHGQSGAKGNFLSAFAVDSVASSGGGQTYVPYTNYASGTTGSGSGSSGSSGSNQTAPNNVNVNYIIKY
jgi:microcystin-dependent protein